jgi:hypothetical protein
LPLPSFFFKKKAAAKKMLSGFKTSNRINSARVRVAAAFQAFTAFKSF